MEKIAIITRTSNRPKYFERCHKSTQNQKDCVHHVIYDTKKDLEYLKGKKLQLHYVDGREIRTAYYAPPPPTARPPILSTHNLYFDEVYPHIKEPWCYHLDDDNYLNGKQLKDLLVGIHPTTELIICRISHFTGLLPRDADFKAKRIRLAGIDTGCFLAKTSLLKKIRWDGWKCGDFRFIDKLSKISKRTEWKNVSVLNMETQNLGKQNDIK